VQGPRLAAIGWRNLWRHRRRTILTLASISFGGLLAVLMTAIQDGSFSNMINVAARMGAGHVTLQHPEFLDTPTLTRTIQAGPLLERGLEDPDVERGAVRISGQLMLSTAGQSYGAGFIAFDPNVENETTLFVLGGVSEGEMLAADDATGILLGRKLADNLDARLGRKVIFTTTDKNGEIIRDVARVRGFIETGSPNLDGAIALLPIARARQMLGYGPDDAIQVALFLNDQRHAGDVARRLNAAVGPEATAHTWAELQPELSGFIAMKVAGAYFFEITIAVLIAAGIFNTLFVSVMERIREFGIMTALGFGPRKLFSMVMYESLFLGLMGLVLAALVTAGPYYYLWTTGIDLTAVLGQEGVEIAGVIFDSTIRVGIFMGHLVVIATAAMLATLLSGLYPAWKAGHVVPVESIRLV
jgi:ABC-type lipoprotein release transport system permease subunit